VLRLPYCWTKKPVVMFGVQTSALTEWRASTTPRMIRVVAGAARRHHVLTLVTSDPGFRAFASVRTIGTE
jgi:hypothetical protein